MDIALLCEKAKAASKSIAFADSETKNRVLKAIADDLLLSRDYIIAENNKDIEAARNNGLSESLIDRLSLDEKRISSISDGITELIYLDDPIGKKLKETVRPNGLEITRISVPMGVIGIIYEARPNVTADAAALCLKAGSAVVLKGGKEAVNSNRAICKVMRVAIEKAGLEKDIVSFVDSVSREDTVSLMKMKQYIDLLIPRGGAGLIRATVENSEIPVIETGTGNCHIYIDESCDDDMACNIVFNAKTSRVSVCNAAESLLIHSSKLEIINKIKHLLDCKGVSLYCSEKVYDVLNDKENVYRATDEDYGKEYLDYKMSVKEVSGIEEAIAHINKYSSHHSECIVTDIEANAERFIREVDSAAVYHNASTRFTDGNEFGLGAEIGISTQKLHARGPMGLEEITTYKYIIKGNGQIR